MSRALKSIALAVVFVVLFSVGRHVVDSHSTSTTTTTTTTSPAGSTTTSLAQTTCAGSDFSGVFNEGEGAAGTIYASVTLTKTTSGTCTVDGWPLLTLQDKLGAVLPVTLVDVPSSSSAGFQFLTAAANAAPTSHTLVQNATVTFALAYSDVPTGTAACESATSLNVQFAAAGSAIDLTPAYPVQPCNGGQVMVSPFYTP